MSTLPFPKPFADAYPLPFPANATPNYKAPTNVAPSCPASPELSLQRALSYAADSSGCYFWRMGCPEHLLNLHGKMTVHNSTVMCFDPNYFRGIKSVRVQRQATPQQFQFIKFLKEVGRQHDFRVIFEIDDIMFCEDIPEYNKFKPAFTDPEIRKTAQEIMEACDEISVTCQFMKDYYSSKSNNKRVTVIPNYPPKWWMGQFYSEQRISQNYDLFKKKPRILYAGSGAHFDVDNRVGQNDDFYHVCQTILKTKDKYQWVFLGAYPLPLHTHVQNGTFEFHNWEQIYHYPEKIYNLKVNAMIAPLQDNIFNRAKSDLKYIEACCYGLPIACQDMCTYANAPYRFTTGDEMIDQLDEILGKKGQYMGISTKARNAANSRWLENEDNINKYVELYTLPYKHADRKLINAINFP